MRQGSRSRYETWLSVDRLSAIGRRGCRGKDIRFCCASLCIVADTVGMARTFETTVYTFGELTDKAKERAIDSARSRGWGDGDAWDSEWRGALSGAADALGFTVKDWSVGTCSHSYCTIDFDTEAADLSGVRAWKYLQNNGVGIAIMDPCPFTGFCGDEALLDPLRAFLLKPDDTNLLGLFQKCVDSWVSAWVSDMEYESSDEAITESIEANEVEFHENGRIL